MVPLLTSLAPWPASLTTDLNLYASATVAAPHTSEMAGLDSFGSAASCSTNESLFALPKSCQGSPVPKYFWYGSTCLAAMRADTRARVAEAYANLTRARNLAALYQNTVLPQAEATASSALAAYRVGGVDFMTLLDNRMIVNRYRQELFRLEAEEGRSWAELEMLLGRQLFDANSPGGTPNGGGR